MRTCGVGNCDRVHLANGMCRMHYERHRRGDDLLVDPLQVRTPIERILARVTVDPETLCWVSGYTRSGGGYTQVSVAGRLVYCHRYTYTFYVGPVPPGLDLDHLCRNRACCNPEHLEPVTPRENILRGVGPTAINARKSAERRKENV